MNQAQRREFVEKHRTGIFGFQRKHGPPSMSVVYYVVDGDDLLVSTMAERAKTKATNAREKLPCACWTRNGRSRTCSSTGPR